MAWTNIYVDNQRFEVKAEVNVLEACLSLGLNLPYFCWHPALGSVGACRQCAVKQFKDEHDTKGRLVMSCLTPIHKDMRISIEDQEAREFRAAIIQGLMQSHPHDCPVCDEGGECHLQDMTLMTGHDYRRYSFPKRTFRNQYLGPFVNQEMNRCIQCYRCVRFYRDYANGTDFDNFGIRNLVFFGRSKDGVLENEFAGNLVEVCPTGVFTDATLKHHYTRKWDLQFAPSVCPHCAVGCNTSPGERYGSLRRIINRYNGEVNGYFLCDRGRFGYEFVNSQQRTRVPKMRVNGKLQDISRAEALERFGELIAPGRKIIGIGSPRASVESNFALRELVGPERFFSGVTEHESYLASRAIEILRNSPVPIASIRHIENSDAVLILGEDLTNTAPRMALSVRQSVRRQPFEEIAAKMKIPAWDDHAVRVAVQDAKGPLYLATPAETKLEDIATGTYHAAPEDIARLGFAVAHILDAEAPEVTDLKPECQSLAKRIAAALRGARQPLVISGISSYNEALLECSANIANALHRIGNSAAFALVQPECNSFGLSLMGAAPIESAFQQIEAGYADTAIILENDLYQRVSAKQADEFLSAAAHVIVLDSLANRTVDQTELLLPVGTFAESEGTFVNYEGRAQRFFRVFVPPEPIEPSWCWIRDGMIAAGRQEGRAWQSLDNVLTTIHQVEPQLARIQEAAPPANLRIVDQRVPRQPHRYSGRTAMLANITVHEPKPPNDPDSSLSFSMEGYPEQPPPALTPFFWAPGWNSIQSLNKFQAEIAGPLRGGDPGIRLFEPATESSTRYFHSVPSAFQTRSGEWLFLRAYHIFGSEELSCHAPGIAQLSPEPYVGLSPADAEKMKLNPESYVEVKLNGVTSSFPVRIVAGLAQGIALLPTGIRVMENLPLPAWGKIVTQA